MTDADYASSTVSQTVRGIALGISAIIYPVIVSEPDKHAIVKDYAAFLAVASFCGITAIVLDAMQYFFVGDYTRNELNRLTKLYKQKQVSDPAVFMDSPDSTAKRIIRALFLLKVVVTGIGGAIVVGVVVCGLAFRI